jgi:hypothetical protein
MHALLLLLSVALAALVWHVTTLRRRVQAQHELLGAATALLRERIDAAAEREDVVAARLAALEADVVKLQGGALKIAYKFCPRAHAADLPPGWVRAPVRDEEEVNPLLR